MMLTDNIPGELRELRQWVAYRRIASKKRPGKTDKIPVDPGTGKNASSTNPATWGTLEAALARATRDNLAGVGFVFTIQDSFVGIDLDDVIDAQGHIEAWAMDHIKLCASYTERSQSGTGVHIITRGKLPPGGCKRGKVEMYDAGRFFVCTGDVLTDYRTIRDAQDAIDRIHQATFGTSQPAQKSTGQPTTLTDAELLAKAQGASNGAKFAALWDGSTSGYTSTSEADLALCSFLAFWSGGDTAQVDRLFRQSGLYRANKWDARHASDGATYGNLTITKAITTTRDFYDGNGREPSINNAAPGRPQPPDKQQVKRRRITSADLVDFLTSAGYSFRLNLCDDSIEVNGERITDVIRAQMRCTLRDAGLAKHLAAAEDASTAHAATNAYHPVRAYLEGLQWSGDWHISRLADHFKDVNHVIGPYLRKWLIGAIRRAYTGDQNAVLVLDGQQGLGKSQFARWLCPLPELFVDAAINPDDKDSSILAMRSWIWEVSELGATTRRTDIEALKAFLSRELFTVRPAYAHFEIVKPGLASFIGTVNNSAGIFSDPTGSRRYWATTITDLDWSYAQHVDVNQVWAEAFAAYRNGEPSTLTTEEAAEARAINETYAFADPVEDLLRKHFRMDASDRTHFTSTADILQTLQTNGMGTNMIANSMRLSTTLKRLHFEKGRDGDINGYWGVWQ